MFFQISKLFQYFKVLLKIVRTLVRVRTLIHLPYIEFNTLILHYFLTYNLAVKTRNFTVKYIIKSLSNIEKSLTNF